MTQIRFFTDEDVYAAVAQSLQQAGWDALSTPQAGRLSESDESQLTFAATGRRLSHEFGLHLLPAIRVNRGQLLTRSTMPTTNATS